jgi:pimeloyl-ACP methyl ester carboxylesterase
MRRLEEYLVRVQGVPPVDLFVAEAGDSSRFPLLVIHGGPDWDHTYLLEPLAHLTTRRILFVDLRGCGRSTRGLGDGAYNPAAATQDLAALLEELRIERADVLGFSYGGLIAQRLAVAAPTRVARLIVASSSVLPVPSNEDGPVRAGDDPWTPEDTRRLALDSTMRDVWNAARVPSYIERLGEVRFSAEWSRPWLAGTLPSPRLEDVVRQLNALEKPVLLLQGRHDTTFPAELVEPTLARMPMASSVVLEEAGHMTHVDQAEDWLQAVRTFLSDD